MTEKNSKTNFKSLYQFMPQDTFRMLICGNSGCGKTNILTHMLMHPLLYYHQIHLYAKNLEQDKYTNMLQKFENINHQVGYYVILCSNDEIIPIDNLMDNESQNIVIFYDFICQKNKSKAIGRLFYSSLFSAFMIFPVIMKKN